MISFHRAFRLWDCASHAVHRYCCLLADGFTHTQSSVRDDSQDSKWMSGHRDRLDHRKRIVVDRLFQDQVCEPLEDIQEAKGKSPFSLDSTYHGCLIVCFSAIFVGKQEVDKDHAANL